MENKAMIVVKLKGGLGNQMFQYAVGRHLAEIHNTELKMDISAYDYDGPIEYALEPFNIQESFASQNEIKKLTEAKQNSFANRLYNLFHSHQKKPDSFIRWNKIGYNPNILKLPDGVYIEGYWQSEKYFLDINQIIKDEFTLKKTQTGKNKEIAEHIMSSESVSLHVRRGDYVDSQSVGSNQDPCGLNYYYSCIDNIVQKVSSPVFFVFSDDIQWCRDCLKISHPAVYVDHNGFDKGYQDMRLMSLCKHNIIANSSFSWWAAWLNQNKNKLVFAPKKWFTNKKNSNDIIPAGWITK
jgi:glycosyl transferase family 11